MPRLRSFRRGAAVTTEDCRWFYKSRAKATSRGGEKTEQDRGEKGSKTEGRNPAKQRKKIHRKNRENTTQNPDPNSSQHRPQCFIARTEKAGKNKKRKGTAGTEAKEKQEGRLQADEGHRAATIPTVSREQVSHFAFVSVHSF
jgi:hypothetical protein